MKKILLIALCLSFGLLFAQGQGDKEQIDAFKKYNKDMLKALKTTYKVKPEVNLSENGQFYIVLPFSEKYIGKQYLLANEAGEIFPEVKIDKYISFDTGEIGVRRQGKWGVYDVTGKMIFPVVYEDISRLYPKEAGMYEYKGVKYWYPNIEGYWIAKEKKDNKDYVIFYSKDGKNELHRYEGKLTWLVGMYPVITPTNHTDKSNDKTMLFPNGDIIYQGYNSFELYPNGFVLGYKIDEDGLITCGGKMLDSSKSQIEIPCTFNRAFFDEKEGVTKVKVYRSDEYQEYDPAKTYVRNFADKGEKLFESGKFNDVIAYYEGEGYGYRRGNYLMGCAAMELADVEMAKMLNCINALKDENTYYYPIENPDAYKFNTTEIASNYANAKIYFEKVLQNDSISNTDPDKINARTLRGKVVTRQNSHSKAIEEYGIAYTNATVKNVDRKQNIAIQQAQQQQQAEQLATGITNLLFGGKK